jgi:F-type H+-transporting ATPase subunit a
MSAAAHGQAAQAGAEQKLELPSFFDIYNSAIDALNQYFPGLHLQGLDMHHSYFGFTIHEWLPTIMSCLVGLVLTGFSLYATRRMDKIPRGAQAFAEIVVEGLYNFLSDSLGKYTARYLPFLGTLFLYILLMNLMGLVPMLHSPTNKINTTLSMAIPVFVFYNYQGIKMKGLKYFKHFFEPLFMAPIMFPLHVIGECVRPVSLSVRLFGNLTGEDLTLALLVTLTPFIFKFIPVPIHLIMVLMALLFSTIQAVIFTLLSTVYLSLAIEEHEEGH